MSLLLLKQIVWSQLEIFQVSSSSLCSVNKYKTSFCLTWELIYTCATEYATQHGDGTETGNKYWEKQSYKNYEILQILKMLACFLQHITVAVWSLPELIFLEHSVNLGEIKLLWEKKKKRKFQDFTSSLDSLKMPNTVLCCEIQKRKEDAFLIYTYLMCEQRKLCQGE